jgi:hypothetical protein
LAQIRALAMAKPNGAKATPCAAEDGRFQVGERGEIDPEINGDDGKFLHFVGYALADRRAYWNRILHARLHIRNGQSVQRTCAAPQSFS